MCIHGRLYRHLPRIRMWKNLANANSQIQVLWKLHSYLWFINLPTEFEICLFPKNFTWYVFFELSGRYLYPDSHFPFGESAALWQVTQEGAYVRLSLTCCAEAFNSRRAFYEICEICGPHHLFSDISLGKFSAHLYLIWGPWCWYG